MSTELKTPVKRSNPLTTREEGVYLNIQITAEALKAGFNHLFKSRDLTGAQYNVLRILRGAGKTGLSCREIGDRMITQDSDITRMLDRLESRGLIRRERQTDDRRVVLAYIAQAGLDLLSQMDGPVQDLHRAQLGHLTTTELDSLSKLLFRARKSGR